MSYDIRLCKTKGSDTPVKVTNHVDGGVYEIGGTDSAVLNITYNYAWFYTHFLDKRLGIRWLYGRQAKDCIDRMERAVEKLGTGKYMRLPEGSDVFDPKTERYWDYYAPTPGNAGYALNILLQWAKEHPEGYFYGD